MKKLITILLCTTYALCLPAHAAKQPLDQTVAIVNDDVISKSELTKALSSAKMMMAQEHATPATPAVLQKQVLDQLINKKIQLQIAKQSGVQVSMAEVEKAIGRIAEQNHMSRSDLYARINQDGMTTEEYRNEIQEQMTLQKLQQQEVASRMTITPQEVTNFMHSRAWQTNASKEYHLQDLLIPLNDSPSTEDVQKAKAHADELMAQIKQGKNFEQITVAESASSQPLQGGDLGWRQLPEIPSAFANQVVGMKANNVAGPIQTPNGFHIIRLVESRALDAKQMASSRKVIENQLLQQKFEQAVHNWVSKLRSQAFVVVNA